MKIFNRRANFDFQLNPERLEAGIALKGIEAKSLSMGRGDLSRSFVKVINSEIYLVNANIPASGSVNYDPTRTRKLLLHKNQIISILTKSKAGNLQIVPIKLYNKGRLVKLEVALGKPKKQFQKKETVKKKDIERDIEEQFKNSV